MSTIDLAYYRALGAEIERSGAVLHRGTREDLADALRYCLAPSSADSLLPEDLADRDLALDAAVDGYLKAAQARTGKSAS